MRSQTSTRSPSDSVANGQSSSGLLSHSANDPAYSSNLLYPKDDRVTGQLMYTCRTCNFKEPAASARTFQNILNNQVGDTAGVTQDVGSDPTVGSPESASDDNNPCCCTMCGETLACVVCGEGRHQERDEERYEDDREDVYSCS